MRKYRFVGHPLAFSHRFGLAGELANLELEA